jgi:hypothetical protein
MSLSSLPNEVIMVISEKLEIEGYFRSTKDR